MGKDNLSDDEYSTLGDKPDIGFIDLQDCTSVCSYNPYEESQSFVISVPFPLVHGKPQSGLMGETTSTAITIQNITNESLDLWSVKIYDSKPDDCFTISLREPPNQNSDEQYIQEFMEGLSLEDRVIRAGHTLTIWLNCKPTSIGLHQTAVHFSIGDDVIERLCFFMAENKLSQSLASQKPFQRRRKNRQSSAAPHSNEAFVAGSRPSRPSKDGHRIQLPEYPIPKEIRYLLDQKQIPDVLNDGLGLENYASHFKALLHMEEIKMEEDMRDYDMEAVKFRRIGYQLLSLVVLGLAERRPSLVCGDYIIAKCSSEKGENKRYQGYIHHVQAEEVHLKFHPDFHHSYREENRYNVQFTYNRASMRRLYQAIEAAEYLGPALLFPFECEERHIQPAEVVPISPKLNTEQICAVELILGCKGESPYVIHGPPGTGKSMTLIEAILQLYSTRKDARILVCAPSNNATDHMLEKLLDQDAVPIKENEILRLNAASRPLEDLDPKYERFCWIYDYSFKTPHFNALKKYRIVVSTYATAYLLHAEGITKGHFSHIFLDEAGQASEPDTMVPLSHFCRKTTVVVLAGDPMQLGPVTYSKEAAVYGSGKSYLERLFECQYYDTNKNYITRLVRNYRSHPSILYLPSKLFYEEQLIACKESDMSSSPPWLDLLPNPDFPVVFMGVQGFDEREGNNPSWFNRIEASKVVEIIDNLVNQKGLNEEDIGVITPYRQQVVKIKKALESLDRFKIKVGSVEQFQGQERKVIIVSTVRSTIRHNEFDRIYYLGFLSNPKRFNVSITRAQSLLILVGNPHIITKDEYWNQILWYCIDNGSYDGCFLPKREEEIAEEETVNYEKNDYSDAAAWLDNSFPDEPPSANATGWLADSIPSKPCNAGCVEGGGSSANEKPATGWLADSIPSKPCNDAGCLEGGCSSADGKPVFDDNEWSDGWK